MPSIFSDYNQMKLEINSRNKTGKFKYVEIKQHTREQPLGQRRNKKGTYKIPQDKQKQNTIYQNLWHVAEAVLKDVWEDIGCIRQ